MTISARNSKASPVLRLPENTKGPADLIKVPDKQALESLTDINEIMRMVDERKLHCFGNIFLELGYNRDGRFSDQQKQEEHDSIAHEMLKENAVDERQKNHKACVDYIQLAREHS